MIRLTPIAAACMLALSGCASTAKIEQMKSGVSANMGDAIASASQSDAPTGFGLKRVDRSTDIPGDAFTVSDIGDDEDRGTVNLQANGPLSSIVGGLAKSSAYSLSWGEGVDRNKAVSIAISGVSETTAIRKAAAAAGYVAVFDRRAHTVLIAPQAVFTFKLPIQVMQQLDTTFTVGGNPLSTSTNSSTGGPPSGGGALSAAFNVNGRVATNGRTWVDYLRDLAGPNASVTASIESGYISVRGNGVALERMRNFLQSFTDTAMRRVEIQASVIDIALGDEFQYGIDWSKLLSNGLGTLGGAINLGINGGASTIVNPSLSVAYTGATASSIINFLKTKTDVKVITQPSVTAMNRTPAVIFDGVQLPYVGSITSTAQQTSTQTSASTSYVVDGVNLSILPEILSDTEAQITILPVVSGVREFKTFDVGGGAQLVAPVQLSKQALMTAMAENGKTIVLGGIRYSNANVLSKDLPGGVIPVGKADSNTAREVAILLRTNVVPGKRHNILFSESI